MFAVNMFCNFKEKGQQLKLELQMDFIEKFNCFL